MTTKKQREQQEARERLGKLIKRGDTVYTVLRHVAKSGMMRVIDLYLIIDNEPYRITGTACDLIDRPYSRKHEGMTMQGCGMDVGFEAVYNLSMALFCPGKYDHDAAYALKQRWLG